MIYSRDTAVEVVKTIMKTSKKFHECTQSECNRKSIEENMNVQHYRIYTYNSPKFNKTLTLTVMLAEGDFYFSVIYDYDLVFRFAIKDDYTYESDVFETQDTEWQFVLSDFNNESLASK